MLFFMLVANTFVTLSMNIAIIAMVRPVPEQQAQSGSTRSVTCPNTTFYWTQTGKEEVSLANIDQVSHFKQIVNYRNRFIGITKVRLGLSHRIPDTVEFQ